MGRAGQEAEPWTWLFGSGWVEDGRGAVGMVRRKRVGAG